MPVGPEVGREVADRRLEGGLRDAHHVVVGDDLLGAVVGQRHDARARGQERAGASRVERHQRVGADVEREREAVARRVDEPALEVLAPGEGQGVDEDVEPAVGRAPASRRPAAIWLVVLDVARLHERRADRLGQRPDALLDEALDRAEADRRALPRGARWAMPQAIEWSLATPKISAVLPSSSPIRTPLERRRDRPSHRCRRPTSTARAYAATIARCRPAPVRELAAALRGVRALLLDLDGVDRPARRAAARGGGGAGRARARGGSPSGS